MTRRRRNLGLFPFGIVAAAALPMPSPAEATTTYSRMGIADGQLPNYTCKAPGIYPTDFVLAGQLLTPSNSTCGPGTAGDETASWTDLRSGLGMQYARAGTPWDTFETYNQTTGQCVASVPSSSAARNWNVQTKNFAYAAHADGLIPVITVSPPDITGGSNPVSNWGYDATPGNSATYVADPVVPDMQTILGKNQYICGWEAITADLDTTGSQGYYVTQFESWNEPNGIGQFEAYDNHGVNPGTSGNAENAAEMYYIAEGFAPSGVSVTPGSFANAQTGDTQSGDVEYDYTEDVLGDGLAPNAWSLHDYDDVVNSGNGCTSIGASGCVTTDLSNYVHMLQSLYSADGKTPPTNVYLTEQAVLLNQTAYGAPDYLDGCSASCAPGAPTEPQINVPQRQADAAEGFLNLGHAGGALGIAVSREFYYTLQSPYDGVIASSPSVGFGYPTGNPGVTQGLYRPSYCVLALGYSPVTAAGTSVCNDETQESSSPASIDADWTNLGSPYYVPGGSGG